MINTDSTKRMSFHLRWKGDIGEVGLFEAVVEALEKGGVFKEAEVLTIDGDSPEIRGSALVLILEPEDTIEVSPKDFEEKLKSNLSEIFPDLKENEEDDGDDKKPQI